MFFEIKYEYAISEPSKFHLRLNFQKSMLVLCALGKSTKLDTWELFHFHVIGIKK